MEKYATNLEVVYGKVQKMTEGPEDVSISPETHETKKDVQDLGNPGSLQ